MSSAPAMNITDDGKARIAATDFMVIVDSSYRMANKGSSKPWDHAKTMMDILAPELIKYDSDGVDFYHTKEPGKKFSDYNAIFASTPSTQSADPGISGCLKPVLERFWTNSGKKPGKNHCRVIVVTSDPGAEDSQTKLLDVIVKNIIQYQIKGKSAGVQAKIGLLQLGNDTRVKEFFSGLDTLSEKKLDNCLETIENAENTDKETKMAAGQVRASDYSVYDFVDHFILEQKDTKPENWKLTKWALLGAES